MPPKFASHACHSGVLAARPSAVGLLFVSANIRGAGKPALFCLLLCEARVRQLQARPTPPLLSTLDVPNLHHQVESLIPSGDDFIFASSASGRGTESGGKGSRRRDDENPGVDTREIGCSREASCSTVAHEPTRSCRPR
ncbi:uncharacterized protein [Triticum aestivum]|uniref:uncharacterized protein n=1 Tax=Triticum aestivum TaxID=4565 RepID=UPI000E7BCC99|nr:uncharacterized protein LOC123136837 [Triticum aestivum]